MQRRDLTSFLLHVRMYASKHVLRSALQRQQGGHDLTVRLLRRQVVEDHARHVSQRGAVQCIERSDSQQSAIVLGAIRGFVSLFRGLPQC